MDKDSGIAALYTGLLNALVVSPDLQTQATSLVIQCEDLSSSIAANLCLQRIMLQRGICLRDCKGGHMLGFDGPYRGTAHACRSGAAYEVKDFFVLASVSFFFDTENLSQYWLLRLMAKVILRRIQLSATNRNKDDKHLVDVIYTYVPVLSQGFP